MSFYKGSKKISGLVKTTDLESILVDDTSVSNLTALSKTEFDTRRLSIINDTTTSTSTTWSSDYFIDKLRGWESITWSDVFTVNTSVFTLQAGYTSVMINRFLRMIMLAVTGNTVNAISANTYFEPIAINAGYRSIVGSPITGQFDGKAMNGHTYGSNFYISSQSNLTANNGIRVSSMWNY